MAFDPALLELMPDTVIAQPGRFNATGAFIPSGAGVPVRCKIEGGARLIRDSAGREVTSTIQISTGGIYSLTTHKHTYSLPSRFDPRIGLHAIRVDLETDEEGPHHEVIYLP